MGLEWVNGANLLPKESIFDQSLQRSDDAFYKDSEPGRSWVLPTAASETIRVPKQVQICSNGPTSINQMISQLFIESFTRLDQFKWTYFGHLKHSVWDSGTDCV